MTKKKQEQEKTEELEEKSQDVEEVVEESGEEEAVTEETDETQGEAEGSEEVASRADLQAEIKALQESVAELEKTAQRNLDGWQRAQASFQNYRKRTEAHKKEWQASANAGLLLRLLPVLDDFKRALDNVPEAIEGHKWLDGILMIKQKLENLLDLEDVTPIEVEPGDLFDPNYHEAVLRQEVEGFDEDEIVTEVQRGYLQGERVLRPTRVVIAKAPTETGSEQAAEAEEQAADTAEMA